MPSLEGSVPEALICRQVMTGVDQSQSWKTIHCDVIERVDCGAGGAVRVDCCGLLSLHMVYGGGRVAMVGDESHRRQWVGVGASA